jgi:hypothetical protein
VRIIRAWNTFWFAPTSARPLGAFRVVFGLVALLNLALLSLERDYWLTDAGILVGSEAREAAGSMKLGGWTFVSRPSPLHYIQDPASVRVFYYATYAVTALFTLGWHTRVMGILTYLGLLSIHHRNISSASGADSLLTIIAFYMMLSPCGAAYSLDARRAARKRGTAADPLILPWAQRLIQIQVALVYLNTALLKASGSTWQDGTALHYVLSNTEMGRFNLGLPQFPLLINFLTYTALIVELAIPFLIWFRAARPWVILAGLGLHFSILFTVNIPIFGELITATYLTFLTPPEFDAFVRALDPRRWLRRADRPAGALDGPQATPGPGVLRGPHQAVPTEPEYATASSEAGWKGPWD